MAMVLIACGTPDDRTISVSANDAEMNLAISKARQALPEFWQVFESRKNGESDFCLKVRIEDSSGTEHFWAINIRRENGKIWGEIGNDANIVKSVKLGDQVPITESDISDWLYMRNGKIVGNFTVRPLLKSMSEEEAQHTRSLLADP
jgi:uncharacterized protein YegJ (DUF2314 family)